MLQSLHVECQKGKPDTYKPAGLYQPVPCPESPWHIVHIDFVTDLWEGEGCSMVMTAMDRFLKMFSFVPLSSIIVASVATNFFKEVVVHHGLPKQFIRDRGPQFISEFWYYLMSALKTNLQFSTAFHPKMDSMAEVSNRTLVQLLCMVPMHLSQNYLLL